MWQSATVAAVALLDFVQDHLLFGGLGGVIAVIVGGVVSAIAVRNARRSVVAPATTPQPASPSRRREPPVSYGEPARPTSPSRRLHPGPVSLGPARQPPVEPMPGGPEGARASSAADDDAPATTLFNPDLFGAAGVASSETGVEPLRASVPLLRSSLTLGAEWAEWSARPAPPQPASGSVHAPLWSRTSFTSPTVEPHGSLESPGPLGASPSASTAPIWRLRAEAFVREEETEPDGAPLSKPPLWGSRLRLASMGANPLEGSEGGLDREDALRIADLLASAPETSTPPLWPSSLRPPAATDADEE